MGATVANSEQLRNAVQDPQRPFRLSYALMGDERETMGERLARLRAMKGWSLADAGKAFGVSRTTVWKWENGETDHIRDYGILERVAAAYGTDVPYIVWGADRAPDGSPPRSPPIDRSGRYKKLP